MSLLKISYQCPQKCRDFQDCYAFQMINFCHLKKNSNLYNFIILIGVMIINSRWKLLAKKVRKHDFVAEFLDIRIIWDQWLEISGLWG